MEKVGKTWSEITKNVDELSQAISHHSRRFAL